MKGKTILGVALSLMLMASLLAFAAPVSADTLEWDVEWEEDDFEIELGTDIVDLAVGDEGAVIYAASGGVAELRTGPDGIAGWSTEEQVSGDYSAYLSDDGTGYTDENDYGAGRVVLLSVNMAFADITSLSYWFNYDDPVSAYPWAFPYMILELDTTVDAALDGVADGWVVLFTSESGYWQPAENTWHWWNSDNSSTDYWIGFGTCAVGKIGVAEDSSLNDFQTDGDLDTAAKAVVLAVKVAVGEWHEGTYDAITGYVDDIVINGNTYDLELMPLYVSKDGGEGWDESVVVADTTIIPPSFVAVSADDPQYLAVATLDGMVYISDDGSATWDSLGDSGVANVADIDISVETDGNHFVAVVGNDWADNVAVAYYEIGAIGAEWTDMTALGTDFTDGDVAGAVAFSPNFVSDEIMVVVTANATDETIDFQMFSFNQDVWNDEAGFSDYPVDILEGTPDDFDSLNAASISLAPDYLGSDDAMRIVFVGIATDEANETSGIFSLDDDDVETLKDEEFIYSVDYDGTNLVAGDYSDTTVYRCDNPLASDPDVSSSAGTKSPGGDDKTLVAWAGDEVAAGTYGNESCFSISRNNGKTFHDLSLIDTGFGTMSDVAVSADGSVVYLVTANGTDSDADLSLWCYADELWQRVLSRQDATTDYIVRIAPDDADVVYVADAGGSSIQYSADGGQERWQTRTSRYPIVDMAVETDGDVVYVLTDNGYVSKSTNTGFSWGGKETTEQSGSNMILSLGEDLVLVGGSTAASYVSYSTDGNESWDDLDELDNPGMVQIAASGLTTDDFIFASTDYATGDGDDIYRWDWADDEWDSIYEEAGSVTGMGLANGALYVVAENATGSISYRTIEPEADDVDDWNTIEVPDGVTFVAVPSALRTSAGSVKLWAIETVTEELYSYEDTVAVTAPTLRVPTHGTSVAINPVTGRAMDLSFTWETPSDDVVAFGLQITLDEDFDEIVLDETVEDGDEGDIISQVAGPNAADRLFEVEFMPETTYYWKVRVNDPVLSPWSVIYAFTVEEAVAPFPEVTVEAPPAPEVTVTAPPAPEVTVTVPPAPAPVTPAPAIPAYLLWTIIIIGAVLMIALIVLIVRTRRVV